MQWVTFAANAASAKARPWAPWAALDGDDNYKGHISIFTVGICSHPFVHCQNSLWFDCGHGRHDHLHSSSSPSSYSVIVTTLRACAAWYCLAAAAASHNNNYHSESESLGGRGRKETRKKYDSTISCPWGELSTAWWNCGDPIPSHIFGQSRRK